MILGIGIDSVDIARLIPWARYTQTQLSRIFHEEELRYCFGSPLKTAERLAARFAAREACFKALAPHTLRPLPFLTLCKKMRVNSLPSGAPKLVIDWPYLVENGYYNTQCIESHISITHSQHTATAIVILEK